MNDTVMVDPPSTSTPSTRSDSPSILRGGARLSLNPAARFVPAGDELRLVCRRGVFALKGKDFRVLYSRLTPILDGRFTCEQILSAVGDRSAPVLRILERLAELGVLLADNSSQDTPVDFPYVRGGLQERVIAGRRVQVNLTGTLNTAAEADSLQVIFATHADLCTHVLSWQHSVPKGHVCLVGCDNRADVAHRLAAARFLLASQLPRAQSSTLSIFDLAPHSLALKRLAHFDHSNLALIPLLQRLQLLRPSYSRQLPLDSWIAEIPGVREPMIGVGLSGDQVRERLSLEIVGRSALLQLTDRQYIEGSASTLGATATPARARFRKDEIDDVVVRSTATECIEALICAWATRRECDERTPVDLLQETPPSARVAVLQQALRHRRRDLPATIDDRLSPLIICRSRDFTVARLGWEEAIAESCMRAVALEYNRFSAGMKVYAPSLLDAEEANRRLDAVIAKAAGSVSFKLARIRRLDRSIHLGALTTGTESAT